LNNSERSFFSVEEEAVFLSRKNRFVLEIELQGQRNTAYIANPGRMQEFLIPGRKILLQRSPSPESTHPFRATAIEHRNKIIPLQSSLANDVAAELVLKKIYPQSTWNAEQYNKDKTSRFDFVSEDRQNAVEVKSVSLCEEGLAMFPDAPSDRALKHLHHLTQEKGSLLFLISHGDAKYFMPNYHSDPLFAKALKDNANRIDIRAVSVKFSPKGTAQLVSDTIPILFPGSIPEDYSLAVFSTANDRCAIKLGKPGSFGKGNNKSFHILLKYNQRHYQQDILKKAAQMLDTGFISEDDSTFVSIGQQNPFFQREFVEYLFSIRAKISLENRI
jgi:sugar fermentation stimulation protein A